jgi:hypothetical protein
MRGRWSARREPTPQPAAADHSDSAERSRRLGHAACSMGTLARGSRAGQNHRPWLREQRTRSPHARVRSDLSGHCCGSSGHARSTPAGGANSRASAAEAADTLAPPPRAEQTLGRLLRKQRTRAPHGRGRGRSGLLLRSGRTALAPGPRAAHMLLKLGGVRPVEASPRTESRAGASTVVVPGAVRSCAWPSPWSIVMVAHATACKSRSLASRMLPLSPCAGARECLHRSASVGRLGGPCLHAGFAA